MRSIWARPRIENNRNVRIIFLYLFINFQFNFKFNFKFLSCSQFYPAKVPNSLHIEMSPFSESVERTMKSNTQLDVDHTIRYRLKIDEKSGAVLTDENGFPMVSTLMLISVMLCYSHSIHSFQRLLFNHDDDIISLRSLVLIFTLILVAFRLLFWDRSPKIVLYLVPLFFFMTVLMLNFIISPDLLM